MTRKNVRPQVRSIAHINSAIGTDLFKKKCKIHKIKSCMNQELRVCPTAHSAIGTDLSNKNR